MSIGDNIKKIRTDRNLTQQQLADQIDISRNYLSELENNKRNLSIETLEKMALKLGVSLGFLVSGAYEDYAEFLLVNLEKELKDNEAISNKVIPFILEDMRSHLFPFLHDYKTTDKADEIFQEMKPILIERWTDPSSIEHYLIDNARKRISNVIIHDTIPYLYKDFYTKSNTREISGDKLTKKSETLIRKLHDLDNIQRTFMDSLRFIEKDGVLDELDKLNEFTDRNTF